MPYKHDYDKILTRLVVILQRLYDGESLSIGELATEFNTSTKTIQRDLNERLIRFPIQRKGNRFVMQEGFSIQKSQDIQENIILDVLERISESIGREFGAKAKGLLAKIKNQHENPFYTHLFLEDMSEKTREVAALEEAIRARKEISFVYDFGNQKRTIEGKPLKIISFDGFWYLLSTDTQGIIKKYYLKAISNVIEGAGRFRVSSTIKSRLEEAISIWFDPNATQSITVRLMIGAEVSRYFQRRPLAKRQITTALHQDGRMEISLKVTNTFEIIPEVLRWIPHIHVLEPETLQNEITEKIHLYLKGIR